MLFRQPGISSLAILALALGIGLTGTMFSIVNGVMLRGLPFDESERLHVLRRDATDARATSMAAPPTFDEYLQWQARQTSFEGLAALEVGIANVLGPDATPERYRGVWQSTNMFRVLRTQPMLGRDFRDDEQREGAAPVVIISDKLWRDRFNGDSAAVGQVMRVNGTAMTVIGVMPPRFGFPVSHDLWMPLRRDPERAARTGGGGLQVIGRLADGVSRDAAAAEFDLLAQPRETRDRVVVSIQPYIESFLGIETMTLLVTMLVAVFGVLLIACANVANLVLARAADRTREVALRSAIGASRSRVIRQMLTEVLVLAMAGAVVGLSLAAGGAEWFNRATVNTNPPFWMDIRIDIPVLLFVAAAAVASALAAGIVPAWRASRSDLASVMNDASRSTGVRMGRFSSGLVVAEFAVSFGLLVASGLAIQSVVNLTRTDFGIPMDDVWTARVVLPAEGYATERSRRELQETLLARLQALPGVVTAAVATDVAPNAQRHGIRLFGHAYDTDSDYHSVRGATVTPEYFRVFRAGVLEGRLFDERDREASQPVALVNQAFARRFFPDGAVGRQLSLAPNAPRQWRTIVGVVPDLGLGELDDDDPGNNGRYREAFYLPAAQAPPAQFAVVAHVAGAPAALSPLVRDALRRIDPDLPISNPRTARDLVRDSTWGYRVFGSLFTAFGCTALLLAIVGLYGVMAFAVTKRTREFGVRMAVGATPGEILWLVLRHGMKQVSLGLAIGLFVAFALATAITLLLFGVTPRDPVMYAAIAAVLAATALCACVIPARRASRLAPVVALRSL